MTGRVTQRGCRRGPHGAAAALGWTAEEACARSPRSFDVEELVDRVVRPCLAHRVPEPARTTTSSGAAAGQRHAERLRAARRHRRRASSEDVDLEKVLSFATVQAQLRIPQKSMQRSYRVSFFVQWELWSTAHRRVRRAADLDRDEAPSQHAQLTQVDPGLPGPRRLAGRRDLHPRLRGAEPVARPRAPEPGARRAARGGRRPVGVRPGDPRLPAGRHHVAVLLPRLAEGAADPARGRPALGVEAHQSLVYPLSLSSTVVWLAGWSRGSRGIDAARRASSTRLGAAAAVSDAAAAGPTGSGSALRQAEDAERVRSRGATRTAPRAVGRAVRRRRARDPAAAGRRAGPGVRGGRARPPRRRHLRGGSAARDARGLVQVRQPRGRRGAPPAARAHGPQPAAQGRGVARALPAGAPYRAPGRRAAGPAARRDARA